ncbi:hypothetical protein A2773_04380 [Candidatus Gottesmanbacteria bacterium RIFCSPHIGHO2_01_FULL_39_10]|uniref:Uncharacterized protein n=1 Tax=Candidatus Gottesmanbacteria bacterium RIFCSPHIGHO2_01_FULL_39_10 TaxID=1798375 RepID=A0A1F5ZRH8_9BACT|nr:MAG: hypothetical protein A2773_04380 [Candidatus Gottesmanbacteria bacterium RIFCSPHIGHO2_01_FULL_39_10]
MTQREDLEDKISKFSHDVKNSITVININIEILKLKLKKSGEIDGQENLAKIESRIGDIMKSLKNLTP